METIASPTTTLLHIQLMALQTATTMAHGGRAGVCAPGTSHVNVNSSLHLIDLFVEYGTVTVKFGHNAHNHGATNHDDGL